jgi:hypothetical protein
MEDNEPKIKRGKKSPASKTKPPAASNVIVAAELLNDPIEESPNDTTAAKVRS